MRHTIVASWLLFTLLSQVLMAGTAQADDTPVVQVFSLNIWAPDEVAPAEAKPVEWGGNYQYQYTPDSLDFLASDTNRVVKFKFDQNLGERYQFRWVTSTHPEHVTLDKKTDSKMRILLEDGDAVTETLYFEVWVQDTHTGEHFMCDPSVRIRRPPA